jgi:hypothetical protein
LPTLGYLIKRGNTSVYEWRTGVAPQHVERGQDVTYTFGDEDETAKKNGEGEEEDQIDFGDMDQAVADALPNDNEVSHEF